MESIYKTVLLDHFRNPRHRDGLEGMEPLARGSNPRCGDEIEVAIRAAEGMLESVRFRGRGCSVCIASASMMCECLSGLTLDEARRQLLQLLEWFDGDDGSAPSCPALTALGELRNHPARRKCVLLAWNALHQILGDS